MKVTDTPVHEKEMIQWDCASWGYGGSLQGFVWRSKGEAGKAWAFLKKQNWKLTLDKMVKSFEIRIYCQALCFCKYIHPKTSEMIHKHLMDGNSSKFIISAVIWSTSLMFLFKKAQVSCVGLFSQNFVNYVLCFLLPSNLNRILQQSMLTFFNHSNLLRQLWNGWFDSY